MSRQYKKLLLLFELSFFQSLIMTGHALEVRTCGSNKTLPFVTVDGCDKEPCKVVNKQNIHFAIDFTTPEDTKELKAYAEAFLDNIQLPYEVPKEYIDACQFIKNTECPLKKFQKVHYELVFFVDTPITNTVDLKFELKDDQNNSVFCLKTKVIIS